MSNLSISFPCPLGLAGYMIHRIYQECKHFIGPRKISLNILKSVHNMDMASKGRPALADEKKLKRGSVHLTAAQWAHVNNQPEGASPYIRRMVEEDRKR